MFKKININDCLSKSGKVVSSLSGIFLGLAVIAVSCVVIKENVSELIPVKKIKARVICIKEAPKPEAKVEENPELKEEEEVAEKKPASKPSPKSKTKVVVNEGSIEFTK